MEQYNFAEDIEDLVHFYKIAHDEKDEKMLEKISALLPKLTRRYGLPEGSSFREIVETYDARRKEIILLLERENYGKLGRVLEEGGAATALQFLEIMFEEHVPKPQRQSEKVKQGKYGEPEDWFYHLLGIAYSEVNLSGAWEMEIAGELFVSLLT